MREQRFALAVSHHENWHLCSPNCIGGQFTWGSEEPIVYADDRNFFWIIGSHDPTMGIAISSGLGRQGALIGFAFLPSSGSTTGCPSSKSPKIQSSKKSSSTSASPSKGAVCPIGSWGLEPTRLCTPEAGPELKQLSVLCLEFGLTGNCGPAR